MARSLKTYFKDAQFSTHDHDRFSKELLSVDRFSDNVDVQEFCDDFIHCLKYIMVEYKPEPTVERLIKFSSKLIADAGSNDKYQILFEKVMEFLLQSYSVNEKAVRYRTCQLIAQILDNLGDAELDDDLYGELFHAMHTRLSDLVPSVRVYAIRALTRMQDPSDKHCPIIKAFMFLMGSDPNWQVRVECLRNVAPTRRSLLAMIERTRDVNEVIRKTAYHMMAEKVSVKALSISQRLNLLETGLADRSAHVRKACTEKLLQAWLVHYQANILDLLGGLDIMSSGEVCEKAVRLILSKAPIDDVISELDLLDDKQLVLEDRMSCESFFYYRVVLDHVNGLGEASAELLERVVPEAKHYIEYINRVTGKLADSESSEMDKAGMEYMLEQMMSCIKYIDVSDPVSRTSVLKMCKDLLSCEHLSLSLVPELMRCVKLVLNGCGERIREVAAIISDIQVPNVVEEQPVDPETLHQLKYKLANVTVNLNELSEMLSEAVGKQDFTSAAEIKEKIEILEVSKKALTEQMAPKPVVVATQARNDEATLLKCLTIFVELMTSSDMAAMTDTIRSYMEELVIPAIPDRCTAVRNQAIKALGLCSLCDQKVAYKFMPVFLQICQLDEEAVRVSALRAMFDIVLVHGIECFQQEAKQYDSPGRPKSAGNTIRPAADEDENKENRADQESTEEDEMLDSADSDTFDADMADSGGSSSETALRSANDLIQMFVDYLEDESSAMRTLCSEGLAKLLVTSKVVSSRLLSRLILLWYNPVTEGDMQLRHCLGVFFPVYAFASRSNQAKVEEAFLPTLKVIFEAPNTSPLSDVDENNVVELLVQLTNRSNLKQMPADTTDDSMTSHDSLAISICNEIIEMGNSYGVSTLTKALNMLDLSSDNEILAKDLKNLCSQLVQVVKDRRVLKVLEKFETKVKQMKCAEETTVTADTHDDEQVTDAHDVIDSSALDTTSLKTPRLKRHISNKSRINSAVMSDLTDGSEQSDEAEQRTARGRKTTKVPRLEEESD